MGIAELLQNSLGGKMLLTFAVSMLPILELRAAIPFGIALGLRSWQALAVSVIGNMVPVPFIILFVRRIFSWLRRKSERLEGFINHLETRAEGKWGKVHRFQNLGLLLLVALPLPGTGAWTGAMIAAIINMRMKRAFFPILLGVLIAGAIISGIAHGFKLMF